MTELFDMLEGAQAKARSLMAMLEAEQQVDRADFCPRVELARLLVSQLQFAITLLKDAED